MLNFITGIINTVNGVAGVMTPCRQMYYRTQPRFSAQECKYATDVACEDATTGPLVNNVQ